MHSDSPLPGDLAAADIRSADAAPGEPARGRRSRIARAQAGGSARLDAHILVVDDEPINVKVMQKFLGSAGYQPFLRRRVASRLWSWSAREMPDVVLLDIFLGDINGIEVLKRLRTLPGGKHLPVLILTASNDPDLRRCALELGAIGFITKPISQVDLVAWLRKSPAGLS